MDTPTNLTVEENNMQLTESCQQDKENFCNTPDDASLNLIRQQCEFYFSDVNILKDQFMLSRVKSSIDGWVKLEIIEKFKKIQKLTQNHDVVVQALSQSSTLELSNDGLCVRRRFPLPEWDSTVYHRTIIISDFPEGTTVDHVEVTQSLTVNNSAPLLVRIFQPGRKVSPDLKRSQALHPQLGVKMCAVVEFSTRILANVAVGAARKLWPGAYVRLLSYGSKKQTEKKSKKDAKENETSGPPPFLLNIKPPSDISRMIHIREPLGPPTEDSTGFSPGWRDLLRLERMSLAPLVSPPQVDLCCGVHPLIPVDSAIVSVVPHSC
ncbi:La domain protein [Paragonimus heterotremus]|uniref:La domain protein n=1 Tax=Paragonimus heterotremus TaxID=100268 RepID=A0A8J4WIM3_9TREM|nr:La domain protein [Paragonimus heterotremus]